jgi:hypothetical protein
MSFRDPFYINSNDVEGLIALVAERLGQKSGQDPTIGAIRRLADLKDRRAIPVLRQALAHPNVTVKTDAALALHQFGEAAGLDSLISWLSSEERLSQRAASALAKINDPRAAEALRSAGSSHHANSTTSNQSSYSAVANRAPAPSAPGGGCVIAIALVALVISILIFASMNGNHGTASQQSSPRQDQTVGTISSVKAIQLNMRSGPGSKYPMVKVFSQNERIVSIGEPQNVNGDMWVQASTPDGQTRGWVNRKFLSP